MTLPKKAADEIVNSAFNFYNSFMPKLLSPPKVLWDQNIACDGLSIPGIIFLHPRLLECSVDFLSLTVAHEVAHQWWGLTSESDMLPTEPMAEVMALYWLSFEHGSIAHNNALAITRGKMFHGFLGMGTDLQEAETMGRQVLVLWDAYRLASGEFWELSKNVYLGLSMTEYIVTHPWVRLLLSTLERAHELPTPAIEDGRVIDIDKTGLLAAVDLSSKNGCRYTVAINHSKKVRGFHVDEIQKGAVLNDSFLDDISTYISALSRTE